MNSHMAFVLLLFFLFSLVKTHNSGVWRASSGCGRSYLFKIRGCGHYEPRVLYNKLQWLNHNRDVVPLYFWTRWKQSGELGYCLQLKAKVTNLSCFCALVFNLHDIFMSCWKFYTYFPCISAGFPHHVRSSSGDHQPDQFLVCK